MIFLKKLPIQDDAASTAHTELVEYDALLLIYKNPAPPAPYNIRAEFVVSELFFFLKGRTKEILLEVFQFVVRKNIDGAQVRDA